MSDDEQPNTLMKKFMGVDARAKGPEDSVPAHIQHKAEAVREREKAICFQLIREREKAICEQLGQTARLAIKNGLTEEDSARLRARARDLVEKDQSPLTQAEKGILLQSVLDELFGFGPLGPLLRDPGVGDICVNGPRAVYAQRGGRFEKAAITFEDEKHLRDTIEKILLPLGLRLDESTPIVRGRMPNGADVMATIPPASIDGTTLSIRFDFAQIFSLGQFVERGTMSLAIASLLRSYIRAKVNIVISGLVGSDAKAFLNALSRHIPEADRVISIEQTASLRLCHEHWVRMNASERSECKPEVSIQQLIAAASQMCADRLVLSECEGASGYEFLRFLNDGRNGAMATVIARSARDCVRRFEEMVRLGDAGMPQDFARELIGENIQVVVHVVRLDDGSNKISEIAELALNDSEVTLTTLFRMKTLGRDDNGFYRCDFVDTGSKSKFIQELSICTSASELDQPD
jgi:pilus assembly protein CpaF